MYGYIYKTTNLKNNKIYVGQHIATQFEPNKYLGSGVALKRAIAKYSKKSFKCELLEWCNNAEELNQKEKFWIEKLNSNNEFNYNLTAGGEGVLSPSQITRQKMREFKLGTKQSQYTKDKKNKRLKNIVHTKEWISKISKSRKGQTPPPGCVENANAKTKDTHWYNNGIVEARFKDSDILKGWVKGRIRNTFPDPKTIKRDISKLIKKSTDITRNSKWYNNGIIEIRLQNSDNIPNDFNLGRLKFKDK